MKPAICTQCGGSIKVDETKELGICEYCNTPFVTERVINNYITKNVHNVTENVTKIIYGKEKDESEDFFRRAMTLIDLEEYTAAADAMRKAVKLSPQKPELWFYRFVAESKNLTTTVTFFHDEYDRSYGGDELYNIATKFFKLAKEEDKAALGERFGFSLTTPERLVIDLLARVEPKEQYDYLISQLYGHKWNEKNREDYRTLHRICLASEKLLGLDHAQLLDEEMLAETKRRYYAKDVSFYQDEHMTVKGYGAWYGDEEIRIDIPARIKTLSLGKGGSALGRLIIPSTVESVSGLDLGLPEIKIEGANVKNSTVDCLLNCVRPEVLYLPEKISARFNRGIPHTPESPEKTVLVCSEVCNISVSFSHFGENRRILTETRYLGGIFGGKIVYPKTNDRNALIGFHENLKKHFHQELENGTVTGLATDEDILAGITPKTEPTKKPGFFARLFGKK